MKFTAINTVDKKVNKSLQDRLRRERISKSVEALRDLVLGPSIEHAKIGKEEILKLTIQYIRRQKELKTTNAEERISIETCNREADAKTRKNDLNQLPVCSTKEQLQAKGEEISEKEVPSENAKTLKYDENHVTNKLSPSQSDNYPARRFAELRNTMHNQRNSTLKRSPFREINCNGNKQTIWRPW